MISRIYTFKIPEYKSFPPALVLIIRIVLSQIINCTFRKCVQLMANHEKYYVIALHIRRFCVATCLALMINIDISDVSAELILYPEKTSNFVCTILSKRQEILQWRISYFAINLECSFFFREID